MKKLNRPSLNESLSSQSSISSTSDSCGNEENYQKAVRFLTEMITKCGSLTADFIDSGHFIATSSAQFSLINLPPVELSASVATSLVHAELGKAIAQLRVLHKRVNDDRASILVTGDVNSGKSTLINAILGSEVCATDQLPSEDTFYQISATRSEAIQTLDSQRMLNEPSRRLLEDGVEKEEEVEEEEEEHQVLSGIPSVTVRCTSQEKYTIIDSPGLNVSCQSTENLLRASEECDIIIPVLSADVGFSLSTTDFLSHAAREKRWLFIIVNKLDLILPQNIERAKKRILDQLHSVSPDTATASNSNATQLVHFISAANPQEPEWSELKASLKDFVLNRRTMTKLSPAQTYMRNLLSDLQLIAKNSVQESARVKAESQAVIDEAAPELSSLQAQFSVMDSKLDFLEMETVQSIKSSTNKEFSQALANLVDDTDIPAFLGWHSLFEWSQSIKIAMLRRLDNVVLSHHIFIRSKVEHAIKEMNLLSTVPGKLIQNAAGGSREAKSVSAMFNSRSLCIGLVQNVHISFLPFFTHSTTSSALIQKSGVDSDTSLLGYLTVAVGGLTVMTSSNSFAVKALFRIVSGRWAAPLLAVTMVAITGWSVYTLPASIPRIIGYSLRSHLTQQLWVANEVGLTVNDSSKVLRSAAFNLRTCHMAIQKEHEQVLASAEHDLHKSEAQLEFYGSYLPKLVDCKHRLVTTNLVSERKVLKSSLSHENLREFIDSQKEDSGTPPQLPTKFQRSMTSAVVMRE